MCSFFVSMFYATRKALGDAYRDPILESFYEFLTREQNKFLYIGVINILGTSNKALVAQ